jgi:hypothetical protein
MRRTTTTFVLALVAAGTLALPAAAKELSVSLAAGPTVSEPGDPWSAQLLVHGEPEMLKQATPSVTIDNGSGTVETFVAKPTGKRAADGQLIYQTRVVFPSEGTWRYTISDGLSDRAYEGGSIRIGEPAAAPAPATGTDGEPAPPLLWPLVIALAVVLAAAGAGLVVRRHRLREAN